MFHFTQQERQVILFLAATAFLGLGIRFLKVRHSDKKIVATIFIQDLGKINLNTAHKELLMSISGIGEKLAGRIIEYRQKNGEFRDPSELKNIKGITHYRYEKIKDYIIVK